MLKSIKTDIFVADCDAIIHQANCFCTMGSGIARFVREKFPEAYAADCKTKKGDKSKLGHASYSLVKSEENPRLRYIFNLYGQYDFGSDKRYTDYDALHKGFTRILSWVKKYNEETGVEPITVLAVPYLMGCNRAGGDWKVVTQILEEIFAQEPAITLLICENPAVDPIQNVASR